MGKVANILRRRPKYKTNYYYKPVTASPAYFKTVTEPDFTVLEDFDWWNNISKYIDDPYGALEKAQKLLEEELRKDLAKEQEKSAGKIHKKPMIFI